MSREVSTDMVRPVHFAHFVIRCSDKAKWLAWYNIVLGM